MLPMPCEGSLPPVMVASAFARSAVMLSLTRSPSTDPMLLTGSCVSGLMCWPDLDVMVFVGAAFSPQDVLRLLQRLVDRFR